MTKDGHCRGRLQYSVEAKIETNERGNIPVSDYNSLLRCSNRLSGKKPTQKSDHGQRLSV